MSSENSSRGWWGLFALGVLLCYPIMAVKWIPFGGGARYLNILAAPVCLILLWQTPRPALRGLLAEAGRWALPFLPFAVVWGFAQAWHGYNPADWNPLTRVLWCALLFIGARRAGVSHRRLAMAAGLGAAVYCAVALYEVYGLGRPRAWGGVYENRFGQFAIWVSVLAFLHVFEDRSKELSPLLRYGLLLAGVLGVGATYLSGSRGAQAGLLVLLAIVLSRAMNWRRRLLAGLLMVGGMLASCYFYPPMLERIEMAYREFFAYFDNAEFDPTSIGIRLELYRIAYLTLLDHPVIGPGYTSLQQLYATHPAFGLPRPEMLGIPAFHNDWAQAVGVGGGLLLAALLISSVWLFREARGNVYRLSFIGCSVIFSASEMFFTNKIGLSLLMATWALYAAAERNKAEARCER